MALNDHAAPPAEERWGPREVALLLALAGMWGLSFTFIKVAVAEVTPLWIVATRVLVGGALLAAAVRLRALRVPWGDRPFLLHLLVLAVATNLVPWTAVAWAQQFIPSGLTAVVNALVPVASLAIAVGVGQERLWATRAVGMALAVVGATVVASDELGAPESATAVLVIVAATVAYGGSAVYAKRHVSGRHPPLVVAFGQVAWSAVLVTPVAALTGPVPLPGRIGDTALLSLLGLGVLGTGLAFLTFYTLVERVGATGATTVTYLIPVVGVTAGVLFLDEALTLAIVAGTALILVGVALTNRRPPTRAGPGHATVAGPGEGEAVRPAPVAAPAGPPTRSSARGSRRSA